MKTVCIKIKDNHPAGVRNRAGFSFSKTPQQIEVTDEELKILKADKELIFCKKKLDIENSIDGEKVYETNTVSKESIMAELDMKGIKYRKTLSKSNLVKLLEESEVIPELNEDNE
jgi:hypothetical protein